MVKISVIMPIYNVEKFLEESLNSLLDQSIKEFELIGIDDGSKDESYDVLLRYSKKDKRIKPFKVENGGPSRARNLGLSKALGEYIVFMDSDDILPKNSLSLRYEAIEREKASIVFGGTNRFNEEKEWRMERHYLEDGEKDLFKNFEILRNLGPCNKIYRRELLKDISFKEDIDYAEDVAFVMEACLKSSKIYAINSLVYKYRDRENSLTDTKYRENIVINKAINSFFYVNKIIDENSKEKGEDLKNKYFERVIDVDIWKPYREILKSHNGEEVKKVIKNLELLVEGLDKSIVENSEKLRIFIIKNLYEFYDVYLENREDYKSLLKKLYGNKEYTSSEYKKVNRVIEKFLKGENKNTLKFYLVKSKILRMIKK